MSENLSFQQLKLPKPILNSLQDLGYESPTSIQEQSIPVLLKGQDLLAQAQTGTGKTAAFALPILSNIQLDLLKPQAIILAPTRELAIQVADSFKAYAKQLPNFQVLAIYGGQDYAIQLRGLKKGAHVIVGTPGRVMDHLRRKTLVTDSIKTVVLDEADEMLNMGFIDDIKWILEQIPTTHQTALFSATMPPSIRQVANQYLKQAKEIHIKGKTTTAGAISQFYVLVSHQDKLEALTRFLEVEETDAVLVFTRTKQATGELAEKLQAQGLAVAAMNGDMNQALREQVIKRLKNKSINIIVATEVVARGLDIDRISHVINFDVPSDVESYVHRIGRTGRAGRSGKALLFVTPKERYMLRDIERSTRQILNQLQPPSIKQINKKRNQNFSELILKTLDSTDLSSYRDIVREITNKGHSEIEIAAALAFLAQKDKPILAKEKEFKVELRVEERRRPMIRTRGRRSYARSMNHVQ